MPNDHYRSLEPIFLAEDLIQCGRNISIFAKDALTSGDRAALVKGYYNALAGIHKEDARHTRRFEIFEGNEAVLRYIALNSPARYSAVKSLESLKGFGDSLCRDFQDPQGLRVSAEQIRGLMGYLDEEFSFPEKVFDRWASYFIILDQSHIRENTHWHKAQSTTGDAMYLFLYPEMQSAEDAAVFLTCQLAGILYFRCSYGPGALTLMIREELEAWYYPDLPFLPQQSRLKVIADALGLGLVIGSPFEPKGSALPQVYERRQRLRQMVRQIFYKL